jgi:hypothetical protein
LSSCSHLRISSTSTLQHTSTRQDPCDAHTGTLQYLVSTF